MGRIQKGTLTNTIFVTYTYNCSFECRLHHTPGGRQLGLWLAMFTPLPIYSHPDLHTIYSICGAQQIARGKFSIDIIFWALFYHSVINHLCFFWQIVSVVCNNQLLSLDTIILSTTLKILSVFDSLIVVLIKKVDFFQIGYNVINLADQTNIYNFQNRENTCEILLSFTHLKTSRVALKLVILFKKNLRHSTKHLNILHVNVDSEWINILLKNLWPINFHINDNKQSII